MPMRAMILCAGLGTRLRPLTERWPKPAMPLLGAPLLRYHLEVLKAAGVQEVGINTHHLADVMRQVAEAECARAGLSLTVVHEPVIQGTGGGIRGLRDFLAASDPFVVLNGDILFPLALGPLVEAHVASGADATMVLQPMPASERYAAVETDARGGVRRIAGLGPGGEHLRPWHFTGVHILRPRVFDFMRPEGPEDINRDVYVRLLEAGGRVRGEVVHGFWSDLGTPSRYRATVLEALEHRVPEGLRPLVDTPCLGKAWVHPGARVEAGSVLGPAFVDAGATVAATARLGAGTYVGRNASIGANARLERAAVLDDTVIGEGEHLEEVIAWRNHRIPAPLSR